MNVSTLIAPGQSDANTRELFQRVALCEDNVVWRKRTSGGRPVRMKQSRSLALVTETPLSSDFLDGRSSRYDTKMVAPTGKACVALHQDASREDGILPGSVSSMNNSFSASTLSWHQKCKLPPMENAIERPQSVQYLRDFFVPNRRRPRTQLGSRSLLQPSYTSLGRYDRELIATEILTTQKYAEEIGEHAPAADLLDAHNKLQPDQIQSQNFNIDSTEDLLDFETSQGVMQENNNLVDPDPAVQLAVEPSRKRCEKGYPVDEEEFEFDPSEIRRLRIESEQAYHQQRADQVRKDKIRHERMRWEAQDRAEERRRKDREQRDAKWQAERSIHIALQRVSSKARDHAIKSIKDDKRKLQERRHLAEQAWHKEMALRVSYLRKHRADVRMQAIGSPSGMRSPIKLKESTIAAQDFLDPIGVEDMMQSSFSGSREFPPAHRGNRDILGGGFNRAIAANKVWKYSIPQNGFF